MYILSDECENRRVVSDSADIIPHSEAQTFNWTYKKENTVLTGGGL